MKDGEEYNEQTNEEEEEEQQEEQEEEQEEQEQVPFSQAKELTTPCQPTSRSLIIDKIKQQRKKSGRRSTDLLFNSPDDISAHSDPDDQSDIDLDTGGGYFSDHNSSSDNSSSSSSSDNSSSSSDSSSSDSDSDCESDFGSDYDFDSMNQVDRSITCQKEPILVSTRSYQFERLLIDSTE